MGCHCLLADWLVTVSRSLFDGEVWWTDAVDQGVMWAAWNTEGQLYKRVLLGANLCSFQTHPSWIPQTSFTSPSYRNPSVAIWGNSRPGFWTSNRDGTLPPVACRSRPFGTAFWRRANTCNQWEKAHLSLSRLAAHKHSHLQESETRACAGSDKRTARRGKTSQKMKWPIDQTTETLTFSLDGFCFLSVLMLRSRCR